MGINQIANNPGLVNNVGIPSGQFFSFEILIAGIYLKIDVCGWRELGNVLLSLGLKQYNTIISESMLGFRSKSAK